jgi:CRP-like cAMP-binding protein
VEACALKADLVEQLQRKQREKEIGIADLGLALFGMKAAPRPTKGSVEHFLSRLRLDERYVDPQQASIPPTPPPSPPTRRKGVNYRHRTSLQMGRDMRPSAERSTSASKDISGAPAVYIPYGGSVLADEHVNASELDREVLNAAMIFDMRHRRNTGGAGALLTALSPDPTWRRVADRYDRAALDEVRRERLAVYEKYDPFAKPPPPGVRRGKRRKRWQLEDSIFAPRTRTGNAKSFWETEEALERLFDADWEFARRGHGLEKLIQSADEQDGGGVWKDEDGNGTHDAVDTTREALRSNAGVIYGAFDYYAALFAPSNAWGEPDVYNMSFNAYLEFMRNSQLESDRCPKRLFETIWVQVNTPEATTKEQDKHNHLRLFNRHEFIQALVRIAIAGDDGKPRSPSAAVQRMFEGLRGSLPAEALQESNEFRRRNCYCFQTDLVLRKHVESLRNLFERYAQVNHDMADSLQHLTLLSCGEWLRFLQDMGLLETGQISEFGAKMVFMWSRMRSASDLSDRSEMRMRNFMFEDFMEAIVRLSTMVALPTDEDLRTSGMEDAGEYLMQLQIDDGQSASAYSQFIRERRTGWQREPRQRVWRCTDHLVTYLIRVIEFNTSRGEHGKYDARVSAAEAAEFLDRRKKGRSLSQLSSETSRMDGIKAAMAIVRQRLLEALHRVDVFSALTPDQLELLRDSMAEAPFKKGEYVFDQGDEGDTFYVITEGSAEVVRWEDGALNETILAALSEGAYFGERAILKKQVRYAGVRATSALHTMSITKRDFEEALGAPLETIIADKYQLNKAELTTALRSIELFANFTDELLEKLRDAMSSQSFKHGELVFEQGDEGNAFYVITHGEASVLRTDEGATEPHELARLQEWAAFGERSLIKSQTRYASIRVETPTLKVMAISAVEFEAAFGIGLGELLKLNVNYD